MFLTFTPTPTPTPSDKFKYNVCVGERVDKFYRFRIETRTVLSFQGHTLKGIDVLEIILADSGNLIIVDSYLSMPPSIA